MSNNIRMILAGVFSFMATAGFTNAETLLGKNYLGGSFGIVQFGDDNLDDIFGNVYVIRARGNIILNPNIDLNLGAGYAWADGNIDALEVDYTETGVDADLIYFFKANEQVNPYITAGLALVNWELEASAGGFSEDQDDTEVGFSAGAGAEIEATEEILLRAGLSYFNIDSDDSISASLSMGYWFSPQMLGAVSAGYNFDSENVSAQVGFTKKL